MTDHGEPVEPCTDYFETLNNYRSLCFCVSVVGLFLLFSLSAQTVFLAGSCFASEQHKDAAVSPQELDRSVNKVLDRREYAWKMPRERHVDKDSDGILSSFVKFVGDTLSYWLKPVGKWILKALKWIVEQLSKVRIGEDRGPVDAGWMKPMQALLYAVLCLAAGGLALVLLRMWRKRRSIKVHVAVEEPRVPDIADDNTTADELPADRWLNLARELMERGDLRLALRALYLACLSHLSQHEMITVARFKSDRDYERELLRKAHNVRPETISAFMENVRIFERIWYGMHEVTAEVLKEFSENQSRIMASGPERAGT